MTQESNGAIKNFLKTIKGYATDFRVYLWFVIVFIGIVLLFWLIRRIWGLTE